MNTTKKERWFVADTHFHHKLMLETRNFETIQDHNNAVADSISKFVKPGDTLYILGDFSFGGFEKHLMAFDILLESYNRINPKEKPYQRLPYNIRLVMGNHDYDKYIKKLKDYSLDENGRNLFDSTHGSTTFPLKRNEDDKTRQSLVATHIPVHPINMSDRVYWTMNVHGHIHEYSIDDDRYICVSWDHFRRPISLTEITDIAKERGII